jgi:hypothetical protein
MAPDGLVGTIGNLFLHSFLVVDTVSRWGGGISSPWQKATTMFAPWELGINDFPILSRRDTVD